MASLPPASLAGNSINVEECHRKVIQALRQADVNKIREILEPIRLTPEALQVLSKPSTSGQYPLHYALRDMLVNDESRTSRLDIVRTIIDSIDKNQRLRHFELRTTMSKHTALHTAVDNEELDVVQEILQSLPPNERMTLIQMTDSRKKTVLQYRVSEPLHALLKSFGHTEANQDSDADERSDAETSGWAVVDCADQISVCSMDPDLEEQSDMISWPQSLTENSADNEAQSTLVTPEKAFEHFDSIIDLVKAQNSYNFLIEKFKNSRGMTILHIAAMHKKVDLVEKLLTALRPSLDHYGIISHCCNQGKTALHYASFSDSLEIVNLLLRHCEVDMRWNLLSALSRSNKSALHYACQVDSLDVVKALLHHSGDGEWDLVCLPEDHPPYNCAVSKELRELLIAVKTHYWKTFYEKPTTLLFYNKFDNFPAPTRRVGAEEEKNHMLNGFDSFEIKAEEHCGFTEDSLRREIVKAVDRKGSDISAIIVVIMSHGTDGVVYDENIGEIRLQRIIDIIGQISMLDNIPKVLILQSCLEVAKKTRGHPRDGASNFDAQDPTATPAVQTGATEGPRLPCNDFCLITSTARGHKSERGVMAKFFAKAACQEETSDMRDLYHALNRGMKKKQTPEIYHNLSRILTLKRKREPCLLQKIKSFFRPH